MTVKYAMDPDVFELEENTPESLLKFFNNTHTAFLVAFYSKKK